MNSNLHGLIIVDKPSGCTSHDIVFKARKILKTKKVGHAGTLDPLASGVLVLLVGQATKLSDYLLAGDKGYEVEVLLGQETDTLDTDGVVTKERKVEKTELEIKEMAASLSGELELKIPDYSAVKVKGKKLYEYAREGKEVPVIKRTSRFYDLEVLGVHFTEGGKATCKARLKCSKGAFIRSWAYELGARLGVGGCVKGLRRVWSSPFDVSQSIPLEALEQQEWREKLIPMKKALPHLSQITPNLYEEKLWLNGQVARALETRLCERGLDDETSQRFQMVSSIDSHLLGILEVTKERGCKIARVFPRT